MGSGKDVVGRKTPIGLVNLKSIEQETAARMRAWLSTPRLGNTAASRFDNAALKMGGEIRYVGYS